MASSTAETEVVGGDRQEPTNRWCHVNRKLLPMKLHWFLYFGSFAGITPACILYCTKVGMSVSEIGTLYAAMPFVEFFSKIILGGIADKYQRHKSVFMASIVCLGAAFFSVNFMPLPSNALHEVEWTPGDQDVSVACRRQQSTGSSTSIGKLQLTLCDRNASNRHFAMLSVATVSCDLSCDTSATHVSTLFCHEGSMNCSSNVWYSAKKRPKSDLINMPNLQSVNSTCTALLIGSITFAADKITLQVQNVSNSTASSFHLEDADAEVSIDFWAAVCIANVRPSVYPEIAENRTLQYVWIWTAYIIAYCFTGILMSTSDTIVLHLLDGRTEDFGKTRLFSAVGWGLMSPIAGLIVDKVSEGRAEKDYSTSFYLFGAFMLADFLLNIPTKVNIPHTSKELSVDVLRVLRRPPFILMIFAVFANGITTGFLWTFLIVYVNELGGGVQLIIGLNYAVECFLSEIPFFIVSGWVVGKLGHSHSMTISLFIVGLKTFLYSRLFDPWYILLIALLHGFTYSLLYASTAIFFSISSPPGTAATFQGIFQGIFEGVGSAAGNLIGGYVYQRFGGRQTMMLFGVMTMGASVVHFFVARILT